MEEEAKRFFIENPGISAFEAASVILHYAIADDGDMDDKKLHMDVLFIEAISRIDDEKNLKILFSMSDAFYAEIISKKLNKYSYF